ncbi:outer membrane beta-barrel protein [Pseudoalteromonas denitrificans]|uniref:Beta-barrel porin 2 n=1 Tax=Pseudoalteromonas denitrificans DSM 6059 TaxID=1123010 RepID=A0A1I1U6R0_9GAMM|nr:outer membrane beta-barrel protein [Pseudoalteromonas denitrificans]SFD64403.1 hypothetical protein SAMN02745724_05069 [Pseudoalteromonas denitrificans DSM 6059]
MKKSILATVIAGTIFNMAYAIEPAGINMENGVTVTPIINMGTKIDDNIFSKATDEKSSAIVTIAPSVNFLLNDGINQHSLDVGITSGTYLSSSDDNFLDGFLSFNSHLEPSSQSRFDFALDANWVTEPRGTGITEGLGDNVTEPLTYADQTFAAGYEYGALSTPARIAFEVKYYNKGYTNFSDTTQYRDFDSVKLGSTFYYNTHAATDVFVEVNQDAIEYDNTKANEVTRNSDDYRALAGIKWEATALTSGTAKLGYQKKDFESASRANFSGLSWEAGVIWQPLSYTIIAFDTSRAARDPNVEGDYINESQYSLNWTHNWNEKISSTLGTSFTDEDYSGVSRTDETTTYSASVNYSLTRWIDMSAFIDVTDKDSTRDGILFDKNVIGMNFTVSM